VTELVQQHDQKEGEVLRDSPHRGGIALLAGVDFVERDDEPEPVEINVDAEESKQADPAHRDEC
jgi:hypothetical protein